MIKNNFFYLLIALIILLLGIPLADDLSIGSAPLVRAFNISLLLAVGVWSLRGVGRYFPVAMTVAVMGVVLNFTAVALDSTVMLHSSLAALFVFLVVAIVFTLKQVVVDRAITVNRLVGALCVYLLLGVIWALTYSFVDAISPNSFTGFEPLQDWEWDSEWLYFSFATMTTLGYGDIVPVSATARSLAYMQAIFGQFYIAILVAGLVSAYISSGHRHDRD